MRVLGHVRGPDLHVSVADLLSASGEFGKNQDQICFFKRWFQPSLTGIFGRGELREDQRGNSGQM